MIVKDLIKRKPFLLFCAIIDCCFLSVLSPRALFFLPRGRNRLIGYSCHPADQVGSVDTQLCKFDHL